MDLGYSVNTDSEEELRAAYDLLAEAKKAGVYQAWVMDEVFDKMEAGEAAVATYYAGDYLSMLENNEDLVYVVPEEGSNWFVDAMCILKNAENVDEAHEWINFMASTDASLKKYGLYLVRLPPIRRPWIPIPTTTRETYGEPLDMERYEIMAAPPGGSGPLRGLSGAPGRHPHPLQRPVDRFGHSLLSSAPFKKTIGPSRKAGVLFLP